MAKTGRVGNMKVRFPKGSGGMTPKARVALSKLMSGKKLRSDKACTIIFVKGGTKAFQRCEGRKLRAHNRKQCRKGGAGNKFKRMQFTKCK